MNDAIASKRLSLILRLVEATMFLKLNMSLILNNQAIIAESLIWNTLIPSQPELPDYIDDSNDNENEEEDDDDNDDDDEDVDLSPVPVESKELAIRVDLKPFSFLVQQHENKESIESNTTKSILFGFI